jgi:non-homologous end joining protein Ku
MAPRAYWKGYLKLSLVSCPIQLFPATSDREKIRFHQINRKTGNRIKFIKVDRTTRQGTLGLTLRYPYEVRDEELYFGNIADEKVPKDMLDLAVEIVRSKARHFQPDKFEDHYESALRELIGKKQRGEKIEKARKRPQAQVINLMDALRRSAEADRSRARAQPQRAPRGQRMPRGRSSTRARKAGG